MKTFFKRLLFGPLPTPHEHAIFGEMLLWKHKKGDWWETEPIVEGRKVGVCIEAGEEGPSESQCQFFQQVAANVDQAFLRTAPQLKAEYEKWVKEPFPANWREAFVLAGFTIPAEGVDMNPWNISFDCLKDKSGHQFTAYYEHGKVAYVSVDG